MPEADQIGALYPASYAPYSPGKPLANSAVGGFLRKVAIAPYTVRFGSTERLCPPFGRGRLLEIGCGAGAFLESMVDLGWDCTGLDTSSMAIAKAKARVPAAKLFAGTLEESGLEGPYDLIVMHHVLEHLARPVDCLNACFKLLEPSGILMIAIPNIQSLEARLFRKHWIGLDVPRHLVHFGEPLLLRTIQKCGYQIVDVRPQMMPSSITESLLVMLPAGLRQRAIGSTLARALYLLMVFPAALSYLFGNRGAIEIRARKPSSG